jgi:hypothetical protein
MLLGSWRKEMKYVKMLGLAAIAAMALMAFGAGTASATKLYSGGTAFGTGTTIKASLNGTAVLETTGGTVLYECKYGSLHWLTATAGGATETVRGTVATSGLTWGEPADCTRTTHTIEGGELEIHHIAGTTNGTLTARGFGVTIASVFGSCTFGFGGAWTDLGTVVGGSPATIEINTLMKKLAGPCPFSEVRWTTKYKFDSPNPFAIEEG